MRLLTLIAAILSVVTTTFGQSNAPSRLQVKRATTPIKVDGKLNEPVWSELSSSGKFTNKWPLDSGFAPLQTDVKVTFDNEALYVGAVVHQDRQSLIIQTLKRDQIESFWSGDAFSVIIDPMNQKSAGFLFGVNPGGAQLEGAINLIGSWSRLNENWDNKWFSSVTITDSAWVVEMAIPFSSLRFKNDKKDWAINFLRNDMKNNVFSVWSPVPLQFNGFSIAHLGTLSWADELNPHRSRVTLIPYVSGSHSRNHEDGEDPKTTGDAGLDMKVAVTSSMNLDVTYRPDFSTVDVDRQLMNVTRFSLLYPEKRNFFLENADLFTNFGSWLVRPFFSRKIGLFDGERIPILAGARLSGNLTKGLRVGIMDVQTEATSEFSANNYFVTSAQQQLFARSNVKVFASNRQTTRTREGDTEHDYNRTYGAEFQYVTPNDKWNGYLRAHTARTPDKLSGNNYFSTQINYNEKNMYAGVMAEQIGENYVNDLGFIPRLHNYDAVRDTTVRIGHYTINPWIGLLLRPKRSKVINLVEPNTWSVINYRTSGEFLERNTSVNLFVAFKDTRELFVEAFDTDVLLPFAADVLDNDKPIPVARYRFTHYSARYSTDSRKPWNGSVNIGYGDFYMGTRFEYGMTLNLRVQPWGAFGISYLQNDLDLGSDFGRAKFKLIGPRAEVSIRNNIWWSAFIQYNTQQDNLNINSRLQWRFKPMSDFFVVYTDNYVSTNLNVRNRGLVFKWTYWLNL